MPRCTRATHDALPDCSHAVNPATCVEGAVRNDPTPTVYVAALGSLRPVNCVGSSTVYACLEWQVYSLWVERCPSEWSTWVNCQTTGGACTSEQTAVSTCANATPDWDTAYLERVTPCFAD